MDRPCIKKLFWINLGCPTGLDIIDTYSLLFLVGNYNKFCRLYYETNRALAAYPFINRTAGTGATGCYRTQSKVVACFTKQQEVIIRQTGTDLLDSYFQHRFCICLPWLPNRKEGRRGQLLAILDAT